MTAIVLATLLRDLIQPTVTASLKRASNTPEDDVILITWLHKSRRAYDKTCRLQKYEEMQPSL